MEMSMEGSSGKFSTMGKSLTKQSYVEVKGPQVVNSFFQRKNNDGI
jgi:hypothetical protein